jgi:hypothetical protein
VPRTAAGVLFAIGVIALAAWLMSMVLGGFSYAVGLSGTPGTFTAAHCHTVGVGRGSTRICTGTFTSADGRVVDTRAHIKNARVYVGKPVGLRRKEDGGYTQPGWTSASMDLAVAFATIAGAAFLLVAPCVMARRVVIEDGVPLRAHPQPWGTLLPLLVCLVAIFLPAAMLSALAGLAFAIGSRIT